MKVKNGLTDLILFGKHTRKRNSLFKSASAEIPSDGAMNRLASRLHPAVQRLQVDHITEETADIRTFRLSAADGADLAPFRAGQYLSLTYEYQGLLISRPYSISSTPSQVFRGNYYDITIRKAAGNAFFSEAAFSEWREGTRVLSSAPNGAFYYEPQRDSDSLICIAGGSGVTPFRSMIEEELEKRESMKIALFYGIGAENDEAFGEEFRSLSGRWGGRFVYIPVVQSPTESWTGKKGFISLDLIKEALGVETVQESSFFICGPEGLHSFMDHELEPLQRPSKFIRRENYGIAAGDSNGKIYKLTVMTRGARRIIDAAAGESLVTAIERAGLAPPAWCRSGDCGWCRSRLIEGEITTDDSLTGLRAADSKFGWIHPCVSYPASDITLEVPSNPIIYSYYG